MLQYLEELQSKFFESSPNLETISASLTKLDNAITFQLSQNKSREKNESGRSTIGAAEKKADSKLKELIDKSRKSVTTSSKDLEKLKGTIGNKFKL